MMADHKIPMNADKAAKERVTKRKKAKAGKKGNPFGDKQAPPFGAKDGDEDEPKGKKPPKAKKSAKPAAAKRKGKGKGRSPAAGVAGHDGDTMGLPAHREPDGAPVEEFEDDAKMQDGDERQEMAAAMRHKSLAAKGLSQQDALLHDMTCPAFAPEDVAAAFPYASFSAIDDGAWQLKALDAAASAALPVAGEVMALWQHAVTLKGADPQLLHDLRTQAYRDFREVNKAFQDATPGPGAFPTPAHVTPERFKRPYISEGHGAASPQHDAPNHFREPEGQISAEDFTRQYITEGRAADSPDNDTPRHEPQPAPMTPGTPERVFYRGTMRDNVRQALHALHDHISRITPDVCPMSPQVTGVQKPAPPVPEGVGGPAPRRTAKATKAAKRKAARAQARKRRRLERKVLKGSMSVNKARKKLGLTPKRGKGRGDLKAMNLAKGAAATPVKFTDVAGRIAPSAPVVTAFDPEALKTAMTEATAPLLERIAAQDKTLRKQRKAIDAIASQPDTSQAPLRGVALNKSQTPAAPAGPLGVAKSAERAQAAELALLYQDWRNNPDPGLREAAYGAITNLLGLNPMNNKT